MGGGGTLVFALLLVPYKMIIGPASSGLVGLAVDGSLDVPDRCPGTASRLIARGVSPSRMYIEKETVSNIFANFIATVILLLV